MTTGASLKPDSASSRPVSRRGSGTVRRTEKTAAASVDDTIAPSSSEVLQSRPTSQWAPAAVTKTLIPTPTVASTVAAPITGLASRQLVLRPPSARITTRAA